MSGFVSLLFAPASRPDRFAKALAAGAQAVIFDLEDSVPEAGKAGARAALAQFLGAGRSGGPGRVVRINRLERAEGRADLQALCGLDVDAVMLPKVEAAEPLAEAARALEQAGSRASLIALVESARGVGRVESIAGQAPARLSALMFGAADYAADLGLQAGGRRADFARDRIVNAAAMAGVAAIDSPFFDIADPAGLEADCAMARAMGFAGKAAIHPSQVGPIEQAFALIEAERTLAARILAAGGDGAAAVLDGKMIDEAVVRWARRAAGGAR
ncbi:HpcH/HpaI aldolase/citrate lyase family protein [Phenylobacterium sp.]|uniref:HpcH/HpaI aldolase/citrate lyase family protein n=1 Tax=Phenylobacterium sp. TaxID=1871053 RepID=UPI002F41E01B